jgi:hypothetical protein
MSVHDVQDFAVRDAVVRVFERSREPGVDDASDMYVLEVFGVSVLVRLRTTREHPASRPQLYIHVDNEDRPPTALAVEVANGGEAHYRI